MRRVAIVSAALLCACTSHAAIDGPSPDAVDAATRQLRAAVATTLALDSFHEAISIARHPRVIVTVDYQAPDRAKRVTSGPRNVIGPDGTPAQGTTVTISVGSASWVSDDARPGYYSPGFPGSVKDILLPLVFAKDATDVTKTGDTYRFQRTEVDSDGSPSSILERVRLSGGKVVWTSVTQMIMDRPYTTTTTFTLFNAAPPVVAPAPDHVVATTTPPVCPSNAALPSGSYICVTGGDPASP